MGRYSQFLKKKAQSYERTSRTASNEGALKICPSCGSHSQESYRFCPYCGSPLDSNGNSSAEDGGTDHYGDRPDIPSVDLYGCPSASELKNYVPEKTIEVVDYGS